MINLSKLELILNKIKKEEGFIGGVVRCMPLSSQNEKYIEAEISFRNFVINFGINPGIEELFKNDQDIIEYVNSSRWSNPVASLCETVFRHEIWHWKRDDFSGKVGCPTDGFHKLKNIDAAYRALQDNGFFKNVEDEKKKLKTANEFAGAFDDVLVNTNLRYENQSNGLSLLYYNASKKGLDALTEAFYRLQMGLWGSDHDKKLLELVYTQEKEDSEKIKKVIDSIIDDWQLKEKGIGNAIKLFRNIGKWDSLAYSFTKNLAQLLEEPEGGAGEEGGEELSLFPQIVVSLDSKNIPESAEEQVVQEAYELKLPGNLPAFMADTHALHLAYKLLAKDVKVVAKSPCAGLVMPLVQRSQELFDITQHDPSEIDFLHPVFDPESDFPEKINFEVPSEHYTIEYPYTSGRGRIPDMLFLCDDSGSMEMGGGEEVLNANWRRNSKYHYLLLGVFGAMQWLKKKRVSPYIKYNITLFSNSTRSSSWVGYGELEKVTNILWHPEFGGTTLDMSVLKKQLAVPHCVVLLFSDGGIWNWGDIKAQFMNSTRKHDLSYIEIQDRTGTGKDLKEAGKPVYHISKASDLEGLVIDVTKKSFKEYAK